MAVLSLDVNPTPNIGVFCADHENDPLFESICERYKFAPLESLPAAGYVLVWAKQHLALHSMGKGAPGPVQVDWSDGKVRRRLQSQAGSSHYQEPLALSLVLHLLCWMQLRD